MSAGRIFGRYEIMRRLAVGGMGEIFLSRQVGVPGFERLVILKSLKPELAGSATAVSQFLDEGRIAGSLNHPNIVAILDVGEWEGVYYLAMEHVNGENLMTIMRKVVGSGGQMPIPIAARIMHGVALGLDYAHGAKDGSGQPRNIVHRDITPHNIMVTLEGMTKIVDFGIAKSTNREAKTAIGMVKGKIRYMSPEQLVSGKTDARSDQFSMGVVFWEVCTGRRLFHSAQDVLAMREAMLEREIPAPHALRPDVPPEISAVVLRALSRDPTKRFPSCGDLASALLPYLSQQPHASDTKAVGELVQNIVGDQVNQRARELVRTEPLAEGWDEGIGVAAPEATLEMSERPAIESTQSVPNFLGPATLHDRPDLQEASERPAIAEVEPVDFEAPTQIKTQIHARRHSLPEPLVSEPSIDTTQPTPDLDETMDDSVRPAEVEEVFTEPNVPHPRAPIPVPTPAAPPQGSPGRGLTLIPLVALGIGLGLWAARSPEPTRPLVEIPAPEQPKTPENEAPPLTAISATPKPPETTAEEGEEEEDEEEEVEEPRQIRISSSPKYAMVTINGAEIGRTPLIIAAPPRGERLEIQVQAEGTVRWKCEVEVQKDGASVHVTKQSHPILSGSIPLTDEKTFSFDLVLPNT